MLGIYSKRAKIYRAAGRVGMLEINSKRANMINLNEGLVDHRRPCYHTYIYIYIYTYIHTFTTLQFGFVVRAPALISGLRFKLPFPCHRPLDKSPESAS